MRIIKYFLIICLLTPTTTIYSQLNDSINVISFNIRYDNPDDGTERWECRKESVLLLIDKFKPDIIGIQEALYNQVEYLSENLKQYNYTGVGRDDGKEEGEFSAIYYNDERFDLLSANTFWLSDNPNKPGVAWGACCNRIVTWAKFKEKLSGNIFFHFNTHFDHQSKNARVNSSILLAEKINELAGLTPVVVTGDFNSASDSEEFLLLLDNASLINCRDFKDNSIIKKDDTTFNGFGKILDNVIIDHILINKGFASAYYKILYDKENNRFISDHFPVLSKITFTNK